MASSILNLLFDTLEERTKDVFFIQVGAMDGVSFDPLRSHIVKYGWSGILVEPLKDLFVQLCANYSDMDNLTFENVAISKQEGMRLMKRVPLSVIRSEHLPDWTRGISSFYSDRNALGGIGCSEQIYGWIKDYVVEEEVECISLDTLINRNEVSKLDLLQIDTEGYDFHILKQLDFSRFRPSLINFEYVLLPPEEQRECLQLLSGYGYKFCQSTQADLIATTWDSVGGVVFRPYSG